MYFENDGNFNRDEGRLVWWAFKHSCGGPLNIHAASELWQP